MNIGLNYSELQKFAKYIYSGELVLQPSEFSMFLNIANE